MPPRRSARASLPTPANSTKAPSIASTPGLPKSATFPDLIGGLITPASSLSDGSEDGMDFEQEVKAETETTRGRKRKAAPSQSPETEEATARDRKRKAAPSESSNSSPFTGPDTPPSTTSTRKTRYVLDAVAIPNRRSKLSTEKTTSADNLTLGSPAARKISSSSIFGKSDPMDAISSLQDNDEEASEIDVKYTPKSKGKAKARNGSRPAHQPFNVGKHSTVTKENVSSLALDSDDSALDSSSDEKPRPKAASRGKGKAKNTSRAKKAKIEPESDYDDVAEGDDDFAMDRDEEERQLKKALQASIGGELDSPAGSSSRSSSAATQSRGRGGKAGRGQSLGGKAAQKPLRTAVARAAEKRAEILAKRPKLDPLQSSPELEESDDGSEFAIDVTPTSASGQQTPLSLDTLDSDLSDASFTNSDDSLPAKKGRKASAKSKGRSKWGKGNRLDGADVDDDDSGIDESALAGMDDETRMMTISKMKAKKRAAKRKQDAERLGPIKESERKLKKELGRKLTNGEKNLIRLEYHHEELRNVWGDLKENIKPVIPTPMEAHPSLKLTLLPFQKESLHWMKKQEEGPWKGGMLADEMGMGKTIQTIALLLSEPRRKPSLVVAPVVALMQWKHEIETHAEGFKVCLWHGQTRVKAAELKKYDVVLSSYGTLEAAFRRQQRGFKRGSSFITEKSPMHEFEWFRVVLDEAHNIKERSTNAAKAAFALQAKYKWCLSGTPLQNRVGELYSLVRFLGADPFSHYFCKQCDCKSLHWAFSDRRHCDHCGHNPMQHVCFWNTEILTPIAKYGIENGNPGHTAFKKLKILLDRMMLRRTKLERADDLGLPPRVITVRRDFFSPAEKELYMSLFTGAKRTFATYVDQGTVLNNYSNIFSLITRMRQMACHPDLVLRSKNSAVVHDNTEGTVCRICNDQAEDAIASQCKHVFDRECIRQYLEVAQQRGHRPECPVCHIEMTIDLEAEALDLDDGGAKKTKQGILSRLNLDNWRSSSKLEALVEELEKLRNKDCTIKSLVFSQFVSFLDLIAFRLQRAGFNICRLEGGMSPQQRDATIQHFMKNTEVTVFLISLKAGGVALNLTEASMVFMMDSWWNPSVEYQAMDRIHRLGQKRPVKVVKLVVEDSIEDQIVQLQAKKLAMTEAALSTDPDAALGKLTVEDLGFLFKL